jgi:hypothetical protein
MPQNGAKLRSHSALRIPHWISRLIENQKSFQQATLATFKQPDPTEQAAQE